MRKQMTEVAITACIQRKQTAGQKIFQICLIFCNSTVTFSDSKAFYTHQCLFHLSLSRAFSLLISKTMVNSMFAKQYVCKTTKRGWKTYIYKQQKLKFPQETFGNYAKIKQGHQQAKLVTSMYVNPTIVGFPQYSC